MTQKMSGITTQHEEKIAELAVELTKTIRRCYPAPVVGAQIFDVLQALAATTVNFMHAAPPAHLGEYNEFFQHRIYEFFVLAKAQVLEDAIRAAEEVIDEQHQ
jgi:hypothetical protein